jgi:cell division septal protein FtsQ
MCAADCAAGVREFAWADAGADSGCSGESRTVMAQLRESARRITNAPARRTRKGGHATRRRPRGRGQASAVLRLFYALGMCVILAAIGHASYGFLVDSPYFRVREVRVEGVSEPIRKELDSLISARLARSPSMISLDMDRLREMIAAHPRVSSARIDRQYPDKLVVRATERTPVAVLSSSGFYLLDNGAVVMEKLKPSALRSFDFPYITGIPAEDVQVGQAIPGHGITRALDLIRMLRDHNAEVYAKLSEINAGKDPVSRLENLTAYLKGGMEVRFGDTNPIQRLPALDLYVKHLREKGMEPFSMAYVDLRFNNQIVFMDNAHALAAAAGVLDKVTADPESAPKPSKPEVGVSAAPHDPADPRGNPADSAPTRRGSAYDTPGAQAQRQPEMRAGAAPAAPQGQDAAPKQGILRRMTGFFRGGQ